MPLLAIEIDLSSFFNINIIVFTTIAFVVSVIVTILLVLGIRPITARARKANNLEPEKLNITYLRLIIYIFAELIAFVSDMFLVIFSMSYTIPWFTILIFLAIVFYKLVFVLFKDYKDLGFDAKGLSKSVKTAIKLAKRKDIDIIIDAIDENNQENIKNEDMQKQTKKPRRGPRSNIQIIILLIISLSFLGLTIYSQQTSTIKNEKVIPIDNDLSKEYILNKKITDAENSNKIIVSSISNNAVDTIILKVSNNKKIKLISDK